MATSDIKRVDGYEHCTLVSSASIFPAASDFSGKGNYIHGIESQNRLSDPADFGLVRNGRLITRLDRRREFEAASARRITLPGRYLYCGPMPAHFGHMLAEGANRLWACREFQNEVDGIIILPGSGMDTLTPKALELLDLFGVNQTKVIELRDIADVESLIVPNPGSEIGRRPQSWYLEKLANLVSVDDFIRSSSPKKIVVSRRSFRFNGRVAGSDYIVDRLICSGYFEFRPEQYSLREQLSIILSADTVVWEEGSSCHILDILPNIRANSALIRRRPDWNEFDTVVGDKSNTDIYLDVRFIDSFRPPMDRLSVFCNPQLLFDWLADRDFVDGKGVFDISEFRRAEELDIIRYYMRFPESLEVGMSYLTSNLERLDFGERHISATARARSFDNIKWNLDTPKPGRTSSKTIVISGWIIDNEADEAVIDVRCENGLQRTANIDISRPDVSRAVLAKDPDGSNCLFGFKVSVPIEWRNLVVYYRNLDRSVILAEICISSPV